MVQEFKLIMLLLSTCEASNAARKAWEEDKDCFHTSEPSSGPGESFHDAITRFRDNGLTAQLAHTATGGILMSTKSFYSRLVKMGFESYEEAEEAVQEHQVQYESVYHRNDTFDAEYCDQS
jgi:hypothetical protein